MALGCNHGQGAAEGGKEEARERRRERPGEGVPWPRSSSLRTPLDTIRARHCPVALVMEVFRDLPCVAELSAFCRCISLSLSVSHAKVHFHSQLGCRIVPDCCALFWRSALDVENLNIVLWSARLLGLVQLYFDSWRVMLLSALFVFSGLVRVCLLVWLFMYCGRFGMYGLEEVLKQDFTGRMPTSASLLTSCAAYWRFPP